MPPLTLSRTRLQVFAIEDTAAQLCWSDLFAGQLLTVGDEEIDVTADGPGAAVFENLRPDTTYDIHLDGRAVARLRTLRPPPGEQLCRFATVNDLHIGERRFGLLRTMHEHDPPGGVETYALRCARAACREATAWGEAALVAKGDLTWSGRLLQFDAVGRLLNEWDGPKLVVLGNHDVGKKAVDGRLALARQGIDIPAEPFHLDLPGIRIVMAQTSVRGEGYGAVDGRQRDAIRDLLEPVPAAFLGMHHYPQRFRHALMYPPGIPGHEAGLLLDTVAAANPNTLVAAGHSHRNRRHRHGPLVVTEVGATMHYPGTWAGYAVHEGGIRQVVRRVSAPEAIRWTERGRRALGGIWGWWAPGLLNHRCFSHPWPNRSRKGAR